MQQILFYFWQLCLLRESPEKLPKSQFAFGLVLLVYLSIASIAVTLNRPEQTFTGIIGSVLVGLGVQISVTWGLLAFKKFSGRLSATLVALLGSNTIILIILMPVNFVLLQDDNTGLTSFANAVSWVCLGWWLAIVGYIYHKAANISILQGSAIAFMTELLGVIATLTLFPVS